MTWWLQNITRHATLHQIGKGKANQPERSLAKQRTTKTAAMQQHLMDLFITPALITTGRSVHLISYMAFRLLSHGFLSTPIQQLMGYLTLT